MLLDMHRAEQNKYLKPALIFWFNYNFFKKTKLTDWNQTNFSN